VNVTTSETNSEVSPTSAAADVLPRTSMTNPTHGTDPSTDANGLSSDDVRHLFSGAPHFTLEKGSHGKSFPQVFFPWNNNLDVADLAERRYLKHESFALSTLHAHLPIPDELDWQPTSTGPLRKEDSWKRPAFELGIFESPNMLGIDGKEPGTVAMRYFLEIPVADRLRTSKQAQKAASAHFADIAHMSTTEAMKAFPEGSPMIGKHAPWQDRRQLMNGGPRAWKRVGVREISMRTIMDRLATISSWHDEVVKRGWRVTILDKQDCQTLHEELFTSFLFPPQKSPKQPDPQCMRNQLDMLYKVLTTPGAWIDFSLVESRLHLGRMLWVVPPQEGENRNRDEMAPAMERWWLLVQLLLSIELILRLDAVLRLGLAERTGEYHITADDIHHFNKLRNTKLDWDMVLARRYLDYLQVLPAPSHFGDTAPINEPKRPGLMSRLSHRSARSVQLRCCDGFGESLILPRRAKIQVDGLLRFARLVNWPNFDPFASRLMRELNDSSLATQSFLATVFGGPMPGASTSSQSSGPRTVELEPAVEKHPGGWLSRAWLTGFVLPGDTACHLLISALLENDPQALAKVGTTAILQGGFILDGQSWWSKACVVGRVLAPSEGVSECMGWISTPRLSPMDKQGTPLPNRWVNVATAHMPNLRENSRIHDGAQVLLESSPLGTGVGKVMAREFAMPGIGLVDHGAETQVSLSNVVLEETPPQGNSTPRRAIDESLTATVQLKMKAIGESSPSDVSFRLIHDAYFVSAHPCQPPHGHAVRTSPSGDVHPTHEHGESLPSHPLHQSYKYILKAVPDLVGATPPNPVDHNQAVWIIDARRSGEKDIFVRAWCSQIGRHAIVSRIGTTCLSCSIREAKAIEVGVIIRVGGYE
jgi:hypothetical protein